MNPSIDVVVRTSDEGLLGAFKEIGVKDVVLPEFEAGLEMTRQALLHLGVPVPEIQRVTESVRHELFAPFFDIGGEYKTLAELRAAEHHFDLRWFDVLAGTTLDGQTIADAEIRKRTGASVVGVIHEGKLHPNPDPSHRLYAGDLVAIIGTDEAWEVFQALASPDPAEPNPGEPFGISTD